MSVKRKLEEMKAQYPEITFRPLTGEADFKHIVQICADMFDQGLVLNVPSIEQIRADYSHLGSCDLITDSLIMLKGEEPLAYSRILHFKSAKEEVEHYHPIRRITQAGMEMGLLDTLMDWNETRVRQMIAQDPNGLPGTINYGSREEDQHWQKKLLANGFSPLIYYYNMSRYLSVPIPRMPLPEGLAVRPFTPGQERQIWDASIEAFEDESESEVMTEAEYQRWLEDPERQPKLYQVAWDGNEVAGMVMAYIDEAYNHRKGVLRGYTEGISVRRPWRGRGLAKALICRSMQQFKDLGMEEVALVVDSHNPSGALNLYTGLGYTAYETEIAYRKRLD